MVSIAYEPKIQTAGILEFESPVLVVATGRLSIPKNGRNRIRLRSR